MAHLPCIIRWRLPFVILHIQIGTGARSKKELDSFHRTMRGCQMQWRKLFWEMPARPTFGDHCVACNVQICFQSVWHNELTPFSKLEQTEQLRVVVTALPGTVQ